MKAKMLALVSHWDDEFLFAISLFLSFFGECYVIFTSEGDCISKEDYYREKKEFESFTREISQFRKEHGLGPYIVGYYPEYGDVNRLSVSLDVHAKVCNILEKLLKDKFEYFVYPCLSTHQSHRQTNGIAESLLRIPYIFNIRHVLMGIYPPEQIFSIQDTFKDSAYRSISVENMKFIKKLYRCYAGKLSNFPLEMLETSFRFTGSKINTDFAQSFFLKRMIL